MNAMRLPIWIVSLCLAAAGALHAQSASSPTSAAASAPPAPLTSQQSRMADCNQKAGDKKGDERRAFMKQCLTDPRTTQQRRMADCNKQAADKKGDDRKAFMQQCLRS